MSKHQTLSPNPKEIKKYICKVSPLTHPTVRMRRRIFDLGLSYDERFRTSQDIALWFDVLDKGYNISNVSDITIYFRLAEDVFKRRSREKAFIEFKIYMNGIYRLHGLFAERQFDINDVVQVHLGVYSELSKSRA